jgi:lon-related putative ATP-dependent protease
MRSRLEVAPELLRRRLDPAELPFETTAQIEPLARTVGQPRALDAIDFGLEVATAGYNLYLAGAPGSGRESTIRDELDRIAPSRARPADWVYVYNFEQPDRPRTIRLPAGSGAVLASDMEEFLATASREISQAFESEVYERRRRELIEELSSRREKLTEELQEFARERSFALEFTPIGIVTVPIVEGQPVSADDVERLPAPLRREIERLGKEISGKAAKTVRRLRQLEKETAERLRALERETALFAIGHRFEELRERYADEEAVLAYLKQVEDDIPGHLPALRLREQERELGSPLAEAESLQREAHLARYAVNVVVDNAATEGAPVVVERNPTFHNVLGRIDYRALLGTMVTDFRQIKAGALLRANGGFLVLDVLDLLRQPFAWEGLKRALLSRELRIENLAEQFTVLPTATLRPEPIPLDVKVVLVGPPLVYHLLFALDDDFRELFKVKADFAPDMDWTEENLSNYAAFVRRCVEDTGLRHFDRSAVARVAEYGARLRDDQRKLSTRLLEISDIVTEASFWAGRAGHDVVLAEDVDQAVAKKEYRSNLVEERIRELIADGTIMIDVDGAKVGQINGLAVLDLGDYRFGRPSRVTARVSLGRGSIESIEREIELSGPIHSKGFLTLAGYLAGKYGQDSPLSLRATVAFEQSYDEVEGDSASSTELYALLSALSGLPLDQGIAVTGSVNQHGEVQAVGAVTTKIEGFYAACRAKGLTGKQGVVIPRANLPNLMLQDEVVAAVERGEFHIWAVTTVEEGIELLTGRPAGELQPDGLYPEGSVNRLVAERLEAMADRLQAFTGTGQAEGEGESSAGQDA